jgi:predicted nucleotide-binding protein (sugar kinase/HSP70/actin superfamily)
VFELDLIDAASGMIDDRVDGLLLASSFSCGTSPVTNSIVRRMVRTRKPSMPVLEVYFDEHSAEAGLVTRLESFVDLLRARERRRS